MLQIENISKNYGELQALSNVSLQIDNNQLFGLLGPNGAGKTTLIRSIMGIVLPDSGKIYLNKKEVTEERSKHFAYLPEERGLYKNMKVGEQLMYLAQLRSLSKTEAKKRIDFWLERFEAAAWWNKKVDQLSKGMQQKIQFISTLVQDADVYIFDEPFSGLDPVNAESLKKEMIALRDKGKVVIFSTHRMEQAEALCDKMALINKGKLILEGNIEDIKLARKKDSVIVRLNDSWEENFTPYSCELIDRLSNNKYRVLFKENKGLSHFISELEQTNNALLEYRIETPSLEEIFIEEVSKQSVS